MKNASNNYAPWFGNVVKLTMRMYLLVTVASAAYLTNVPQSFTQPDGSILKCLATGDENHHWLHDSQGYTIIQDAKTGYFVYAKLSDEGLRPTAAIPGIHDPRSANLEPNYRGNLNVPSRFLDYTSARDLDDRYTAPTSGELNNIVIFIRFQDQSEFTEENTEFFGRFNDDQISLKNYYLEASYSQLLIETHFYPEATNSYPTSYQDAHPRAYYSPYNAVTNTIGYPVDENGDPSDDQARLREHTLLKNAVLAVSSQIPENLNIDGDDDGLVDNVCFIVQGGEDGWSDLLWPHMWVLWSFDPDYGGTGNVLINGKTVWTYNLNLSEYSGNTGTGVGVLAHEMFHSLGAPDLYHYSYDGLTPAGAWDLMQNSGDPPHHMTAYMKYRYGNWISSIPELTESGTYSLNSLLSVDNNCYKIQSPNSSSEYFVLEYREDIGLYESTIPGTGLIVYRINTAQDGEGNRNGPPDELYIFRPNGSPTVDGAINSAHLSATVGRTEINDFSNPASFLSDGSPAGLDISQVGAGGTGSIQFYFNNATVTNFPDLTAGSACANWGDALVLSPVSGEFTTDGASEPFLPGDYYINSAIQNIGDADAVFLDDQGAWRVFLDDVQVQNWGWWTASRTAERASLDLEEQMQVYLDADKTSRSGMAMREWVDRNRVGLEALSASRNGVGAGHVQRNNFNIISSGGMRDIAFSESFESGLTGWTLNDGNAGTAETWYQRADYAQDGAYSAGIDYHSTITVDQGLLSPVLDLSAYAGQNLSLSFFQRATFESYYVWHDVSIWVDGVLNVSYELGAATADWTEMALDLSAYAGMTGVQIEFYYYGLDADDWFVDAVTLNSSVPVAEHIIPAGQCMSGFTSFPTYLEAGTHELRLEVDPDGFIAESDESNNTYTRTIIVENSGPGSTCDNPLVAVEGLNSGTVAPSWYDFTATMDGAITITSDIDAQIQDTYVYVYSDCEGTLIGSDDDGGTGTTSVLTFSSVSGMTYYIFWSDVYDNTPFNWQLTQQSGVADLTSGSGCTDWGDALVLSPVSDEFTTDGADEPFLPGDYYINSVIQNIGTTDAVFLDNQSAWKVFLDDQQIHNIGWWTAASIPEHAASREFRLRPPLESSGRMKKGGMPPETWYIQNQAGLDRLRTIRSRGSAGQIFRMENTLFSPSSTRDLILVEDFEAWPNGWVLQDYDGNGDGWTQSSAFAYDGSYSAGIDFNETVTLDQALLSPVLDLSGYAGQSLRLSFYQRGDFNTDYVWHDVSIWIDGNYIDGIELGAASSDWAEVNLDLSDYAGMASVQIGFYYYGLNADSWYVDAVTLNSSDQAAEHIIAAGQCVPFYNSGTPTYLSPGEHTLRIEVDPDGLIAESDEFNNSYSRTITVEGADLPPNVAWSQTYGGEGDENIWSVLPTADGGYLLLAYTTSYGPGDRDAYLIKTDANGNELWSRTYGDFEDNVLLSLIEAGDGSYLLCGYTYSLAADSYDGWMVKVDASGNELWNHSFEGENDYLYFIQPTSDGGYVSVGKSYSIETGLSHGLLIKVDSAGDELWRQTYGVAEDVVSLFDLEQTSDGGYLLTGRISINNTGDYDGLVVKIDAAGNELWNQSYGGSQFASISRIIPSNDNGYYLAGRTASSGNINRDGWLLKIDATGNQIWEQIYNLGQEEWFNSIAYAPDGGLILSGNQESASGDTIAAILVHTDVNGDALWTQVLGEFENHYNSWPQSIQSTSDGGYVLCGGTNSYGFSDGWLLKLSPDGGPISIAAARQLPIGTTVTTGGVVTSINFNPSGTEYSIQDATAGIILYFSGSMIDLNLGDQVLITGSIEDYMGKLEIVPVAETDVSVTATGLALPEPVILTIAQLNASGENYESELIRIDQASNNGSGDPWPITAFNADVNIIDDSGEGGVLRIDKETDIDGSPEPVWPVDIIGVVSEFYGIYQILPRFMADIIQSAPELSHFDLVYSGNPYLAMNIYATSITLEGVDLVNGDEVGIYDGENCVGAGIVFGTIDPFLAMIASTDDPGTPEIDGFTPGHPISYRLWDASEAVEISNVSSIYSLGDGLFTSQGTAIVDLAGMTQVDLSLTLDSGWNIMSLYANPDDLNLLNIVQPLIENSSLLKIQDETGSAIENLPVIGWVNNIGDLSVSEGYYIKMSTTGELNLVGNPVALPFALSLNAGWNIMGYPLVGSQDALTAVQGLIDDGSLIKVQDETGAAIEELPLVGWINSIGDFTAGEGYYIKVATNTTITLDNQTALAREAIQAIKPGTHFELLASGNPYLAMNIYVMNAILDDEALEAGTEIAVFDGDLCVGSAELTQSLASELEYLPLVVGMDDPSTNEVDGFTAGHSASFRIWNAEKEQSIAVVPITEGGQVTFTAQGSMVVNLVGVTLPVSYALYDCYPNPFNPSTTISYDLPQDTKVQLVIYDVLGREVRTLISHSETAGKKAVVWDGKDNLGRNIPSGIYPVRLQAGSYMKVKKALFIK